MPTKPMPRVYKTQIGRYQFVREGDHNRFCGLRITTSPDAMSVARSHFLELGETFQESVWILTLDTKLKPIAWHKITTGTLDTSLVHPREVFRPAILDGAAGILLAHNHPSGDPTPSREDYSVTDQLTEVGKLIGIQVLDHVVIGDGTWKAQSIRDSR